jgi:S-adenosylmethionine:tRNA ribosyltransferase-isomerase
MKIKEFEYHLPEELIAQYPLRERDRSRLLILDRASKEIIHARFYEISNFFKAKDVLVINNTKVFKARLKGKKPTGGAVELLLIKEQAEGIWESMVSPSRRVRSGTQVILKDDVYAKILEKKGARCLVAFNIPSDKVITDFGVVPLPHYIKRSAIPNDEKKYQTTFAKKTGSIAAPTAGMHFSQEVLKTCREKGVRLTEITLHIGPGTFKPIRTEEIEDHVMEPEYYDISRDSINSINNASRIISVGTSVCRTLETFARTHDTEGSAELFIYPGHKFKMVDCLVTNFHLPGSTPLLLVCAFADKDLIFKAYQEAIEKKYRFLSYGDAMLII